MSGWVCGWPAVVLFVDESQGVDRPSICLSYAEGQSLHPHSLSSLPPITTTTAVMEWLFGRKKTPDELLRQNQRVLNKAIRELERERTKMEGQVSRGAE